jgi:hypothetical protein
MMGSFKPNASTISIFDAKNLMIKKFENVSFVNGTYSGSLQLADEVNAGVWSLVVTAQGQTFRKTVNVNIQFKRDEPIHLEVKIEPHILYGHGIIPISIRAHDKFERSIEGHVVLKCLKDQKLIFKTQSLIFGESLVELDLVKDLGLTAGDRTLDFLVEVHEALSGRIATEKASAMIHSKEYDIAIEGGGLKTSTYHCLVTVKKFDGTPAPRDSQISLEMTVYSDSQILEQATNNFVIQENGKAKIRIPNVSMEATKLSLTVMFEQFKGTLNESRTGLSKATISLHPITQV